MFSILRCYFGLIVCAVIGFFAIYILIFRPKKIIGFINRNSKIIFILALVAAVLGRYISILAYFGVEKFVLDFDLFVYWSNILTTDGLKGFMSEYPAGFLYILTGLRYLQKLVGLGDNYIVTCMLLKTPAIITEIVMGVFVYKLSAKHLQKSTALMLSIFILFCPAYVQNSSMWGQVEGLFILLIVLALYFLDGDKRFISALFYMGACLIKAQAIFFAPVFGMMYIMPLIKKDNVLTKKNILFNYILTPLLCVVIFSFLTLPFKENISDLWLVQFFNHIAVEHPANTMSALNLFGLHGGNGVSYENSFLFMNYKIWGYIFIGQICIACVIFSLKNKKHSIYLLSAFCIASIFTLGVSMHERYILPVIILLVISYIYEKNINLLILSVVYSTLATINQSMILFDLFGGKTWTFKLFSGISFAIYLYLLGTTIYMLYFKGCEKSNLVELSENVEKEIKKEAQL